MSESTADIYKEIADKAIAERDSLWTQMGEETARANMLELERDSLRTELDAAREALDNAIELCDEMICYVPEYFREKWKHDEELTAVKDARAALTPRAESTE